MLTDLAKPGGGLGWVSALDVEGRTIWIVDAHGYGKRFVVRSDEKLTAFLELESAKALVYEIQVDQPHVRRRPTLKLGDACLDQFVRVSQPAFVLGGTTASYTCRVWGAVIF